MLIWVWKLEKNKKLKMKIYFFFFFLLLFYEGAHAMKIVFIISKCMLWMEIFPLLYFWWNACGCMMWAIFLKMHERMSMYKWWNAIDGALFFLFLMECMCVHDVSNFCDCILVCRCMFMRWKFYRECRSRVHVMRNKFLLNANYKCMLWDIFVMHEMIFFFFL